MSAKPLQINLKYRMKKSGQSDVSASSGPNHSEPLKEVQRMTYAVNITIPHLISTSLMNGSAL